MEPEVVDIASVLPFIFQDLSLLKVINDLDSYPVELLATLPRWLRHRLLDNLPALDFCRLEDTAVAEGVSRISNRGLTQETFFSKKILPERSRPHSRDSRCGV